ncbi:hypothetical protein D3C72_2313560 [compost metagenome]
MINQNLVVLSSEFVCLEEVKLRDSSTILHGEVGSRGRDGLSLVRLELDPVRTGGFR